MSGDTYTADALILRKTKLGESDLIVKMMGADGSLIEAVAKHARKPKSALSARLELFNRVRVLAACGKSLDIIKECRLERSSGALASDPALWASASCVAEFAAKSIQPNLPVPKMFACTDTAFESVARGSADNIAGITAAYILKASALMGVRPSFTQCAICGADVCATGRAHDADFTGKGLSESASFSLYDGGAICRQCASSCETETLPVLLLAWLQLILYSTFEDLLAEDGLDCRVGLDMLDLAGRWASVHFGIRLKSLPSVLAYCAVPSN